MYSLFHLQRHTTESFQSLLNSEEGKKQFVTGTWPNVTTVTVGNDACDDVSGCATGNDEGQVTKQKLIHTFKYRPQKREGLWWPVSLCNTYHG